MRVPYRFLQQPAGQPQLEPQPKLHQTPTDERMVALAVAGQELFDEGSLVVISIDRGEAGKLNLRELIPDAEILVALEPEELGLRLLPLVAQMPAGNRQLEFAIRQVEENFPGRGSGQVGIAVREAWAWLEGAGLLVEAPQYMAPHPIRILSRRAAKIASNPDLRHSVVGHHLPKEVLHESIREDVWALFHRGRYDSAVFEAMKAVEVAVRDASGLAQKDIGIGLMRKAFDPETGPLTDMSAEKAEREARSHFFTGAIGSYKNPHSHRNVALDDPAEAAEIILIANHLLRIVDSSRASTSK